MKVTQGQFSFLPELTDDEIRMQCSYALQNGWGNYGWATLNYANTSPVHSGANSIKQMGAVVKAAKSLLEGKTVDGKALSDRVRDRLSKLG